MHYPNGDVCHYRDMRIFATEFSGEFAHSMETALGSGPD